MADHGIMKEWSAKRGGVGMILSIGNEVISKENLESKGHVVHFINKIGKNMALIVLQDGDKVVRYSDDIVLPRMIRTHRMMSKGQKLIPYSSSEYREEIKREVERRG
jgi:hypothetical protein